MNIKSTLIKGELEKKRPVGLHPNIFNGSRKFDHRLRPQNGTTIYRELAPRVGKTEIEPVLLIEQPPPPFTLSWHSTCGNIRCEDGPGIFVSHTLILLKIITTLSYFIVNWFCKSLPSI